VIPNDGISDSVRSSRAPGVGLVSAADAVRASGTRCSGTRMVERWPPFRATSTSTVSPGLRKAIASCSWAT
jgi:hypothetical protein